MIEEKLDEEYKNEGMLAMRVRCHRRRRRQLTVIIIMKNRHDEHFGCLSPHTSVVLCTAPLLAAVPDSSAMANERERLCETKLKKNA